MVTLYKILAHLISLLVIVQAALVAYAMFALGHWVYGGGVLDKAALGSGAAPGSGGFDAHQMIGERVVPLVALAFLVVAVLTKLRTAIVFAAITLAISILLILLGSWAHSTPWLGAVHGILAIGLVAVAELGAARVGRTPSPA